VSENKRIATKKAQSRNRRTRDRARQSMKQKLTAKHGAARADTMMKGKDVHKTKGGTTLVGHAEHGKRHGRGNKGPRGKYTNK
jgi:hypothetical protein